MPILSRYLRHVKIVVHFDSCDSTLTYINRFFLFASFPSVRSDHPELRVSIYSLSSHTHLYLLSFRRALQVEINKLSSF